MTRVIVLLLTLSPLLCNGQDELPEDACHFHNLKTETTPLGRTIDYRKVSDSTYHIYYGKRDRLRKIPNDFYCTAPVLTKPYLEHENKEFMFMSHRCGTACRIGTILPMDPRLKIKTIPYWLTYDLTKDVIVSMDYDFENQSMQIKLMELDTYEEKNFDTGVSCEYAVPIDCFQEVKIVEDKVIITWDKDVEAAPYEIGLKN